jgi:Mn2+/Fe2+ NRAMP family transporter
LSQGHDINFGLIWALLLINLIKYPFFAFGVHYTSRTGQDLLTAFNKMGRWVLMVYFILTLCTMFTFQTAVTIVTAGIATSLTGIGTPVVWAGLILLACFLILIRGRFSVLDQVIGGKAKLSSIPETTGTTVTSLARANPL